jgi:lipoprotein-anchoring transpeptidase ErfK/SrfK
LDAATRLREATDRFPAGAALSTLASEIVVVERRMPDFSRRSVLLGSASLAAAGLAGCDQAPVLPGPEPRLGQRPPARLRPRPEPMLEPDSEPPFETGAGGEFAALYGPVRGEPFPVPAAPLSRINPAFLRRRVAYASAEPPGTIIVDPRAHYLYHVLDGGRAMRYGVGVGRQGFSWSGRAEIHDKQEWPDWYPPKEMVQRQPELRKQLSELQSGLGVPGGPRNPLGARAMYLWQNNKDTLYRIHGTLEPWTIGKSVSSGCIRMINQDAIDLYNRTPVGAKVLVVG